MAMELGADGGGGREAASRPLTAEEETLKRNTDCIYFLASPLTCKKGNECEYRHSEVARVNPRDCWYWLHGNCLNPKCSFRHPPLDGLFGIPAATPVPAPSSQTVSTAEIPVLHPPATNNINKQSVPCYFFQNGLCLKGDKCSFMHGPQPAGAPVAQQVAKVSASVAQTLKESLGLKECTSQQNMPKARVDKPVEVVPSAAKPVTKAESLPNNHFAVKRSSPPYPVENGFPTSETISAPVSSDDALGMPRGHQSQPVDELLQNGRDADEFLGESSPGFDVIVDDDIEGSDYLHNEDDFRRELAQGGRNLYPVTEFNYHHSDYEPVTSFERDRYNGLDDYDRYGQAHDSYGREQRRTSSERILDRHLMPERRVLQREESCEEMDGSDLRHRLLKRRRINGSRAPASKDRRAESYRRDDRHVDEERYRGRHSHREQQHFPRETIRSSISSRLQGRITLPVRYSPDRPIDPRSERDRDRGRHQSRLSPVRPINSQGMHHDGINRRSHEDFTADARNLRGQPVKRDDTCPLNFAGPKSLAELKGVKVSESSQEQSTKSINTRPSPERRSANLGKAVGCQESEGSLSFEGPKPLTDILKRKRGTAPENGSTSSNENGSSFAPAAVSGPQFVCSSEAEKVNHTASSMKEPPKVGAADEEEEEEGVILSDGECVQSPAKVQIEECIMMADAGEDRELENSDQRNEESDYEAIEAGELKAEDESVYQDGDEEFDDEEDDDDDDDFARKVGVMFS